MATTQRLKKALERLEARRVELERQIVADLDQRFFSDDSPAPASSYSYRIGVKLFDGLLSDPVTETEGASQYTVTWFLTH